MIASALTDIPGASAAIYGGYVTYANSAKSRMIQVQPRLIRDYGAVSNQVARAMADGARNTARVDYAVAVTGIAGPDGGSDAKPVGTVCISVATPQETAVRTFRFPGTRELVKAYSALTALDMVRRLLIAAPPNADWNDRR